MWKITEKQYSAEDGSTYTSYGVCYGECSVDDITPVIQRLRNSPTR